MRMVCLGLNHRTAPVEIRERFSVPSHRLQNAGKSIRELPGVEQCVVLSTCNRMEIYYWSDNPENAREHILSHFLGDGRGIVTTDLTVTNEAVRKLIYTPDIFAIELAYNGGKKMAVLREVQFHPVKDNILHIDLLEVTDKKPVVMSVPVKIEGHAEGVKAGGKLTLSMKKLKVKALYTDIPERLVINVDHLGLGKTLQVGELHFEGLELVSPKEAVVCAVQLTRAARGAAAAAAAGK